MKKNFSFYIDFSDIEEKIIEAAYQSIDAGENPKGIDFSKVYPAFVYFVVKQIEKTIEEIEYDPEGCLYRNDQDYVKGIFDNCFVDSSIKKRIDEYEEYLLKESQEKNK